MAGVSVAGLRLLWDEVGAVARGGMQSCVNLGKKVEYYVKCDGKHSDSFIIFKVYFLIFIEVQ